MPLSWPVEAFNVTPAGNAPHRDRIGVGTQSTRGGNGLINGLLAVIGGIASGAIVNVTQVPAGPAVTLILRPLLPVKVATIGEADESVTVTSWPWFPLPALQLITPLTRPALDSVSRSGRVDGPDRENEYGAVPPLITGVV